MSPVDTRFNERNWIAMFSNTANSTLRSQSDETARRIITLLTGSPPGGDVTPPDVPTNLEAASGVESVSLSWSESYALDTDRYRVQRSTTSGSGFATVTETLDTGIIDGGLTGGTTYYYKVAAIDDSGNVSAYTDEVSSVPTASGGSGTPPEAPTSVVAYAGDAVVELEWDRNDPTAVFSTVYRDTDTGGPYTAVASGLIGESYTDDTVTNATEYFYVITCTNGNGDESEYSLEVSATPTATTNANPHAVAISSISQGYLALKLAWTPNTDTDFALYRLKYGTTTGVYTEEVEVTSQSLQSLWITGLDAGTSYYFVIEVEDTAGNLSTESDEETGATFDATSPSVEVNTPPAAPSGLYLIEEGDTFVRIGWTANTESDASAYILFRNNGQGGPLGARASTQHPTSVYQFNGLVNDRTYLFGVLCQDTAGNVSEISTISGSPSANTGTVIPPGGGTGVGGLFSGDTGLGPFHKAPGATFDVLFNFSGPGFLGSNMWGLIGSAIRNYAATQPAGFTWASKRVAILLPEREFNTRDNANLNGVAINTNSNGFGIDISLPFATGVQWHFIAPWPTASLSDSSATAKAASKKFSLCRKDLAQQAYHGGGGSLMELSWGGSPGNGTRFGFWWCEFQANGRHTLSTPSYLSNPSVMNFHAFLTLYGCDFCADVPFSNLGVGYTEDTISTFGISIDNVHYCTFDNPWAWRHHIYEHSPGPVGDAYCTETDFLRCGAQVWQQTRRGIEGPDLTLGAVSAGKHYFINVTMKYFGRHAAWGTAALTQYGTRRDIDMQGCTIVSTTFTTQNWPPVNPYLWELPGPYADNWGTDLVQYSAEPGTTNLVHRSTEHRACGGFKMRDCDVYIRQPRSGIVRIYSGTDIDLEDCSFLTAAASTDLRGVTLCYNTGLSTPGAIAPAYPIGSFRMVNCNTEARKTAFIAAHPEVPADALRTGYIRRYLPPPPAGQRNDNSVAANIPCTASTTLTNIP